MRRGICAFWLFCALLVFPALPAKAQLTLNLNPAVYNTTAGSSVTLLGVLTNTGSETLFLNGIDVTFLVGGEFFTLDFDVFNNNVPFFLEGGESYQTEGTPGALIGVILGGDTPEDAYSGTLTLLGGVDSGAVEPLAQANFTVSTLPVATAAPEPTTVLLLGIALLIPFRRR